jgi:predicted nucleic acid-binding protein
MKYLFDTCMLSEINHPKGNPVVKQYAAGLRQDDVFISVVSMGEIAKGLSAMAAGSRKQRLIRWQQEILEYNAAQILAIDVEAAMLWGEMTERLKRAGRQLHMADGLIAATAICRGLHVVTRNVDDFEQTGALLVNPWGLN